MSYKTIIIINPVAGTGKINAVRDYLSAERNSWDETPEIIETRYPGHCAKICEDALKQNAKKIIVAGGDGTVNEAGKVLAGSNVKLGIVPAGSGNGLALHLGIPLNVKKAFDVIIKGSSRSIDILKINEKYCLGLAGLGFDGHIASLFQHSKKRGLKKYVVLIMKEFFSYQPHSYSISTPEVQFDVNAFMVVIANSGQFGNNARVCSFSDISDGQFELCILQKFPWYTIPEMAFRLFAGNIGASDYVETLSVNKAEIINKYNQPLHLDGEPNGNPEKLSVSIIPDALNILVPAKSNNYGSKK